MAYEENIYLHYVLQNFSGSTIQLLNVDELTIDFEGFRDVFEYLNAFTYEAPQELVSNLLQKMEDG